MNLVDQIKQNLSDADINQLSSMIGASEGATRSAVGAAVPSLLSALSGLAQSGPGAQKLLTALGQAGTGAAGLATSLADRSGAALDRANNLLGTLVGGNALSGMIGGISRFAGVAWGGCQKLLGVLTPAILGTIASRFAGKPLNVQSLGGLFSEQKQAIASSLPSGYSLPDLSSVAGAAAQGVSNAASAVGHGVNYAARQVAATAEEAARSTTKWLLTLAGIALLALLAWWLWPKPAHTLSPAMTAPSLVDLPAYASTWKNDVTGAMSTLTDTLTSIKDSASLDTAIPKLNDLDQKLGDLRNRMADMPTAATTALGTAARPMLTTIRDLIAKAIAIPGVGDKLKPITDSILAKLTALIP